MLRTKSSLNNTLNTKINLAARSKFNLFIKAREIDQITKSLHKLDFMSKAAKMSWARENEMIIEEMLEDFMDDSSLVLERQNLDGESLQLSMELVRSLRETSELLQNLLYEDQI